MILFFSVISYFLKIKYLFKKLSLKTIKFKFLSNQIKSHYYFYDEYDDFVSEIKHFAYFSQSLNYYYS
jgi:hypothetical protein